MERGHVSGHPPSAGGGPGRGAAHAAVTPSWPETQSWSLKSGLQPRNPTCLSLKQLSGSGGHAVGCGRRAGQSLRGRGLEQAQAGRPVWRGGGCGHVCCCGCRVSHRGVTARPCWPGRGSESLTAASAFRSQRSGTRACAPNIPPCRRLPRSLPRPRRASPGWGFSCWARLSPAPSVGCGAGRGALHTGRPCAPAPKSTLRPARRLPSRSTPRCVLTPPRRFSRSRTGRISC